jgi:hypothetical protein
VHGPEAARHCGVARGPVAGGLEGRAARRRLLRRQRRGPAGRAGWARCGRHCRPR